MGQQKSFRRPKNALRYFLVCVALIALLAYQGAQYPKPQSQTNEDNPALSRERAAHILHGNKTGGGHLYGTGKPCKSEFPQDWDEAKILGTIEQIAANDNLPWRQQGNGYYVAEQQQNDIKIRVVIDGKKQNIITGYPVNTPRNPCPANDNNRD